MKKVVFCVPTLTKPYQQTLDSLAASVPLIQAAGWEDAMVSEVGCPYISAARSTMLRKALDAKADIVVFIDHDLSWRPEDLLKLIETEGDVVAGTYRFKRDPEEYMGQLLAGDDGTPIVRADGCLEAFCIPAGFLKITKEGVGDFMRGYPGLVYGPAYSPSVDLFNHGAHNGTWYGEDYAFSRNWRALGKKIWVIPDLQLDHHNKEQPYPGNLHKFLLGQPGGSECAPE